MAERQNRESRGKTDSRKSVSHIISKVVGAVEAVLVILLLYFAVVKGYQFGYQVFSTEEYRKTVGITVSFTVEEGETTREVAHRLKQEGLIEDAFVFQIQAKVFQKPIVAGIYELGDGMSSREILEVLNHTE